MLSNQSNRYQELHKQTIETIVADFLKLKIQQKKSNKEIEEELGININKINGFKKELGFQSTRKKVNMTLEQRLDKSNKIKIALKNRKEYNEEIAKADAIRDSITKDEYEQLLKNITDKYFNKKKTKNTKKTNTIQEVTDDQNDNENENENEKIKRYRKSRNIKAGSSSSGLDVNSILNNYNVQVRQFNNEPTTPDENEINQILRTVSKPSTS